MSGSFLVHRLRDQTYWLYLPTTPEPSAPLPLIVMLHGCGQTAAEFAQGSRMNQYAWCAILYPEQNRAANSMRCWNWFEPEGLDGRADCALIVQLIRDAQARYPINPAHCYVVGFSAGAAMAAVLCSTHPDLFAGCALHSGLMAQAATSLSQAVACMRHGVDPEAFNRSVQRMRARLSAGAHTAPTLVIHGSADLIVNPVNAQQIAEQTRVLNTRLNGSVEPLFSSERWTDSPGRPYRQQEMTLGDKLLLRTLIIEGLGHAWSGGDARHEYFDPVGPDASRLILEFLLPPAAAPGPNDAG
ncbi:MAG TPA: PHB depolymerase family esterase [Steroidobacteraceae bacterium]|jgi:poly(hydroxyalkanoate) depolymerase family esterase|nr:PHB depolymerase family esterase [Steroidobacteraceae bacterium]